MSAFLRRNSPRWASFWVTAALYLIGQAAVDIGMWLTDLGEEKFTAGVSLWRWLMLAVNLTAGSVFMLRGLMNGSYQEAAKKADPTVNTGP
jgi:hypothetical protein